MKPAPQKGDPSFEQAPVQVDARGLRCPLPVIRLAEVARDAPAGTRILVLASDPAARHDIPAWCRMRHHELLEVTEVPGPAADTGENADSAQRQRAQTMHAQADGAQLEDAPSAYLRFVVRLLAQPANDDGSGNGRDRSSRAT